MGKREKKTRGEKRRREKQKYFNNRDCVARKKFDLPPNSSVQIELQMSFTLPIFDYSSSLSANNYRYVKVFLLTLLSLSFFYSLYIVFLSLLWQTRDSPFFSYPRACFLHLTISLELVPSTVNILSLSLRFLFPELFPPPPRVVFYYRWIPPPQSLPVIPPGNPFPSCGATNVKIFQSLNFIAIHTPSRGASHITQEGEAVKGMIYYIRRSQPPGHCLHHDQDSRMLRMIFNESRPPIVCDCWSTTRDSYQIDALKKKAILVKKENLLEKSFDEHPSSSAFTLQ